MGARCGERADVEQQVQRLFDPQRVVVGQGMGLAPLPTGRVVAQGFPQVLQAVLPRHAHHGVTVGALVGSAGVPPRRIGIRRQARQGCVDGAGADQHREPGVAQLVMQGRECQLVEELVEQRGTGRVERVVAAPGCQLLDQLLLFVTFGHCA